MAKIPDLYNDPLDQIEYLVLRKFPRLSWDAKNAARTLEHFQSGGDSIQEVQLAADEYRRELAKKSVDELKELVAAELQKEAVVAQARDLAEERNRFFNQPSALADVDYWSVWPDWSIEEGIVLALDRDPRVVTFDWIKPYVGVSRVAKLFSDLMTLAERTRQSGLLKVRNPPGEFLRWIDRTKLVTIPQRLLAAVEAQGIQLIDWQDVASSQRETLERSTELVSSQRAMLQTLSAERDALLAQVRNSSGPWPWGTHETPLLRHLAAAADKWWKNFDPSDPTTAPTSPKVKKWLVERKVPRRVAEVFAQALRAPDIPPGPRK